MLPTRNSHRMISRLHLSWKVPISELEFQPVAGGEPIKVPYISPIDLLGFLLKRHPELLWGGFRDPSDAANPMKTFWSSYKSRHPGHQVFQEHEHSLEYTIPIMVYGDEGRGRRRGQTAVFALEVCFGLQTAINARDGNSCMNCSCCAPAATTQQQFAHVQADPALMGHALCAATALKEASFLPRFPLWTLPCSTYKEHPQLMPFIMRKIALELRQLFFEGLHIQGRVFTFALVAMKGDMKWLAAVGNMNRYYGKKGNLLPGMTRFTQAGPGRKPARLQCKRARLMITSLSGCTSVTLST